MVPDLEELRSQIESITADAKKLTARVSEPQFNWRPEPGKWSIAQCLAHLNAVGAIQLPRIEASIRKAREAGLLGDGPYRNGFIGNFFVSLAEPPPRQKFKAPKAMRPPAAESPNKTVPEFLALQGRILEQLRKANGVDLGRAKVESPISSWLHFTLGQSLKLVAAHQRRHLWQAWQIRNDPKFPAS